MKKVYIFLMVITAFLCIGCSPVDKVKWSKIDLVGNEIHVKKIISRMQGESGKVVWKQYPRDINKEYDIVSSTINRKGTLFYLKFIYNHKNNECSLVEYRVNGIPESPFFIYMYLSENKNSFIPGFLEPYLWIF